MKRLTMLLLLAAAGPASGQISNTPAAASGSDRLGPWEVHRSPEAGITEALPCDPILSYSDPQDGYGHQTEQVQLRCEKPLGGSDRAFFRLTRTTYPSDPALARQNYEKYATFARSDHHSGPTVQLAGQERQVHIDYVLKQRAVGGILGLIETNDGCMWNFIGLDGGSQVQIVMDLPKDMCPAGSEPIVTKVAAKFLDSVLIDSR